MSIPEKILELLCTDRLYKEDLVKYIDHLGTMRSVHSFGHLRDIYQHTVKIEGMERIFREVFDIGQQLARETGHWGPVTCHLFWAKPGSYSFPEHTDPYDVYLSVVSGSKGMRINGEERTLTPADPMVHLPGSVPHQAVNHHESWMLSFGLDTFIAERG